MKKEQIFDEMDECLRHGSISGFNAQLDRLFKKLGENKASESFCEYIIGRYTTYKADTMARLLQEVIHKYPNVAHHQFPKNPLFKLVCFKGSMELFECYIEEAVEPYLDGKDEDFVLDYYSELYMIAEEIREQTFEDYIPCKKGKDFNGAFATSESNHLLSINREDYQTMDKIVEHFNAIIGRRDIIKKLEERMF